MRERLRTCAAYEFRRACVCPETMSVIDAKNASRGREREFPTVSRPLLWGKFPCRLRVTWLDFRGTTGHHGPEPGSVAARPLSTQWLSDERIAEARRVWSKAYGRVISQDEAIEILTNVRRLAEVLLRAEEEKRRT
jgi:hypothetical protein